jgi:hypothetical protein
MLKRSTATGLMPWRLQGALQVFTAELAVVGAVVEDRQLAQALAHHGLLDDHRRLDGIGRRDAEDVVVGVLGRQELLGDDRPVATEVIIGMWACW